MVCNFKIFIISLIIFVAGFGIASSEISEKSYINDQQYAKADNRGGTSVHEYADMVNNLMHMAYKLVDDIDGLLKRQDLYPHVEKHYEEMYEMADNMKDFEYEDMEDVREAGAKLYELENELDHLEHHLLNAIKLNKRLDFEEEEIRQMMHLLKEELEDLQSFYSRIEKMMLMSGQ